MFLPSSQEIRALHPLSEDARASIEANRRTIEACLDGSDPHVVLITGPCSLHSKESALDYARHLQEIQDEVKESLLLVMRAYVEKPRTRLGWKGPLYSPLPNEEEDLSAGLIWTRETLCALAELGIPLATEFLEPLAAPYFEDLISLGFIGSRTTTSQIHRQLASALSLPIGFKNTPDGSIESAINSIHAAAHSHTFFHIAPDGRIASRKSAGNPKTYLVLRGADLAPNFDPHSVTKALNALKQSKLHESVIIDCSHGNSGKDPIKQLAAFENVIAQIEGGQKHIRAIMLESHIKEGCQSPFGSDPEVSLTDPCLDWETTARALRSAHLALQRRAPALHPGP